MVTIDYHSQHLSYQGLCRNYGEPAKKDGFCGSEYCFLSVQAGQDGWQAATGSTLFTPPHPFAETRQRERCESRHQKASPWLWHFLWN